MCIIICLKYALCGDYIYNVYVYTQIMYNVDTHSLATFVKFCAVVPIGVPVEMAGMACLDPSVVQTYQTLPSFDLKRRVVRRKSTISTTNYVLWEHTTNYMYLVPSLSNPQIFIACSRKN